MRNHQRSRSRPRLAHDSAPAERPPAPALDADAVLAAVGEAAYAWDIASDALTWSHNAAEVLALDDPAASASGRAYARLLAPDSPATRFDAVMQASEPDTGRGVRYEVQYALQPRPDLRLWVEDTGRWFAGPNGRPARAHGVVRVINERHAHEERLAYLSRFDDLTGEMNRWRLTETLAAALDNAVKCRGSCAFLLVAIDNLARINDAYGYRIADEIIGAVAKRLRAKLRSVDALGRFSGNKFGVVLHNCGADEMATAAERLLAGVRDDAVQTAAGPVAVTATIGGIVAPRHAREVHDTLARALEALGAAKAKRPGSFHAYRPSVERDTLRRENVRATDEIVAALNDRRILLAFEPVVDAATRQTVFHEALMRIRRADGALVPATALIPIAERLGLIRLIDNRVLELAMAELIAAPGLTLSLNVSPSSTVDADWWAGLEARLLAHPGLGERLIVEITEMAEIHDVDGCRGFVSRAKDLGCRIAIDDFGAGHTSFRNLRRLGVDVIKIDGAFVQNLTRSADDRAFVRTMLDLARSLELKTVAEWVQDEASAALLRDWGCDYLQGALVGLASAATAWRTEAAGAGARAG